MIAALRNGTLIAPLIFEGSCDGVSFEYYVEHSLCPELKPGNVVVMDNYSIHKSKKVKQLIEAVGCKIIFLPPYSPDFNPIEHSWFVIKNFIRKVLTSNPSLSLMSAICFSFNNYATLS